MLKTKIRTLTLLLVGAPVRVLAWRQGGPSRRLVMTLKSGFHNLDSQKLVFSEHFKRKKPTHGSLCWRWCPPGCMPTPGSSIEIMSGWRWSCCCCCCCCPPPPESCCCSELSLFQIVGNSTVTRLPPEEREESNPLWSGYLFFV